MSSVPDSRIRHLNRSRTSARGAYVLYWMIAARRPHHNFALQYAVERSQELNRPLVILEAVRADYPWASDRHHTALLAGMRDNQKAFARYPVQYYPYVESRLGESRGLLDTMAEDACMVVTDDAHVLFLPGMLSAIAPNLAVPLIAIDGNGLYPIGHTDRVFTTAASFRRHLQKELPEQLATFPKQNPLARADLPRPVSVATRIVSRWPRAEFDAASKQLGQLPIDHDVGPVNFPHGPQAARKALNHFLRANFDDYVELRNQPEATCQSYLSPHLHYGHISAHEIFLRIMKREDWSPERLAEKATGSREGWWGASAPTESFLDQLITWRELGFNMAHRHPHSEEFESLPQWALTTLELHTNDVREFQYSLSDFEFSRTHDDLWNAAQTQLRSEGTIHNYLRMLWGKKILEWSATPRSALETMIHLNNKYALDGRDPNSYSGIFWVLGRYDRAWGPERPIFGKVRYMSSENTARKVRVRNYVRRYRAE